MKVGDEIRITGPEGSAFLGEEGFVERVRGDGALLWRPHLWGNESIWIDPRCAAPIRGTSPERNDAK